MRLKLVRFCLVGLEKIIARIFCYGEGWHKLEAHIFAKQQYYQWDDKAETKYIIRNDTVREDLHPLIFLPEFEQYLKRYSCVLSCINDE